MYQLEMFDKESTMCLIYRKVEWAIRDARYWEDIAEVTISGPYTLEELIEDGAELYLI